MTESAPAADLDEVIRLEVALLQPANRADPSFVRSVLHPEFAEFGTSGRVWDVDSITAALAADPGERASEATRFEGVFLAVDAILLIYRTPTSLRSSVWVRSPGGGWRVRFHQGTPVRSYPESGPSSGRSSNS